MKGTRRDHGLKVAGEGEGLVGHAGALLLRKLADQAGLTGSLGSALARAGSSRWWTRGLALVSMAVAITLGATSMKRHRLAGSPRPGAGYRAQRHHGPADAGTGRSGHPGQDRDSAGQSPGARLEADRGDPGRVPLAGHRPGRHLDHRALRQGRGSSHLQEGYGFHPLGAWLANTAESLAMLLRPGNAGSNTFADHLAVLTAAIRQIPARMRSRLLVRVDGAGASHELITHSLSLSTARRTVLFTCGWMITPADEDAIRKLPASAWQAGLDQDGTVQEDKHVAELTHLLSRAAGWPAGLRWIVRRTKPSRRQAKNLTTFEKATGWRYSIIVTNIPGAGIPGVPGSHHPPFIDITHREHAVVEDGVRAGKAMGLRNLPSKTWQVNCGLPAVDAARPAGAPRPPAHTEDQLHLALERRLPGLLAAAVRPARTRLTSHPPPRPREGARPGAVGAGAAPSTSGGTATRRGTTSQTPRPKTGTTRSVTSLNPPPESSRLTRRSGPGLERALALRRGRYTIVGQIRNSLRPKDAREEVADNQVRAQPGPHPGRPDLRLPEAAAGRLF
jgi:hypothetical protein